MTGVAITGSAVYLPGADRPGPPAYPPELARKVLGRKRLLFKEPATRLALCAVHRMLGLPDGEPGHDRPLEPRTAVVASSNLGNVETVADIVRTVRADGWRAVSPLAAPNASSNVLASAVAGWFRFGGPNFLVCSGATGGLDAVAVAVRLLRARRADRVVVVGAEPADEVATALHERRTAQSGPLRAGAACLSLTAATRGVPILRVSSPVDAPESPPDAGFGDSYGAHGIIAAALAVQDLPADPVRVVCGDPADGWRALELERRSVG